MRASETVVIRRQNKALILVSGGGQQNKASTWVESESTLPIKLYRHRKDTITSMTIQRFGEGDRVQIDIPDETDPDFKFHRCIGEVMETIEDDAGRETGDERDSLIYRIELDSGDTIDVRWRDLRPAD